MWTYFKCVCATNFDMSQVIVGMNWMCTASDSAWIRRCRISLSFNSFEWNCALHKKKCCIYTKYTISKCPMHRFELINTLILGIHQVWPSCNCLQCNWALHSTHCCIYTKYIMHTQYISCTHNISCLTNQSTEMHFVYMQQQFLCRAQWNSR